MFCAWIKVQMNVNMFVWVYEWLESRTDLSPGLSFTDLGLQGQLVLAGQLSLLLQGGV